MSLEGVDMDAGSGTNRRHSKPIPTPSAVLLMQALPPLFHWALSHVAWRAFISLARPGCG